MAKKATKKIRMDVRFDPDVHAGLAKLAEGADVSINALVNALGRWAMTAGEVAKTRRGPHQEAATSRIIFSRPNAHGETLFTLDFRPRVEYVDTSG
ncbi:MAG TPA: toxin-antitoxin system HicB family antitoxin [Pirellulales bacterium]|nr:toxin-antitoxin system HicB family antitoxin [Pirellulales bacterium]